MNKKKSTLNSKISIILRWPIINSPPDYLLWSKNHYFETSRFSMCLSNVFTTGPSSSHPDAHWFRLERGWHTLKATCRDFSFPPELLTAESVRLGVRQRSVKIARLKLSSHPNFPSLCSVGYVQNHTRGIYPGHYPTNSFCKLCRAFIPVPGTSVRSVRLSYS